MEAGIQTFQRVGKNSDLENQLSDLEDRIRNLKSIVHESEIRKEIGVATEYINQGTVETIKNLDVGHPDNSVGFITKDLMLKVKSVSGRDDYLQETGSASNWLVYHTVTILASQQFFQARESAAVPNLVTFDQPSQAYFPQRSRNSTLPEEDVQIANEDKQAVQKIFITMDEFLHDTQKDVRTIVTEHADEDIWGDVSSSHLAERWRGSNDKLIPTEWITQGQAKGSKQAGV